MKHLISKVYLGIRDIFMYRSPSVRTFHTIPAFTNEKAIIDQVIFSETVLFRYPKWVTEEAVLLF